MSFCCSYLSIIHPYRIALFCSDGCPSIANTGYCIVPATVDRFTDDYNTPPVQGSCNLQVVCEAEVSPLCPFGWVFYLDDGSEGVNSCVKFSTYVVSNWTMASQSCPAGSHLLTSQASPTHCSPLLLAYRTIKFKRSSDVINPATLPAWVPGGVGLILQTPAI